MNIEKIFRNIPLFGEIKKDIILFESKYPVLFTCLNNEDIYLFSCCLVSSKIVKWIGTRTNYDNLINLLTNRITIRESILNVTDEKIIIEYDGKMTRFETVNKLDVPLEMLPTDGEYMDVEVGEYIDEIAVFER